MLNKIAWRNVWRNKTRSLVIVSAIALGLWGSVFMISISTGVSVARKQEVIHSQLSHIQIHTPNFRSNYEVSEYIPDAQKIAAVLAKDPNIQSFTARTIVTGMASSPITGTGVMIHGIDPVTEPQVTDVYKDVVEGGFFAEDKKNRAVVGRALAKKLNLKLNSKMVLTLQDTAGNLVSGAFRISGIYETVSTKYDEANIYLRSTDINILTGTDGLVHEFAMLLKDDEQLELTKARLVAAMPALKVETWKDLSPELRYMDEMMDYFLYIFVGVVLLALAFGLVNTMLMAVLERVRELGMLMAIGMTKVRLFFMIVLETMFMAITGAVAGIGFAHFSIVYFSRHGIDLSFLQKGLAEFGIGTVLYPALEPRYYFILAVMVFVFSVLSALYPALKALELNPVQAIRKI